MDHFLIDTNFFISLNQISPNLWLNKLNAIKDENEGIQFHLSGQILGEMPFLRGDEKKFFTSIVNIDKVTESDLVGLKGDLGEKNPAQDPDLTLLFLADKYTQKGTAWLVSDDFKLVQNTQKLNKDIRILTPGSFLLKLYTLTKDKFLKRYFKSMEKKVTDYSIKYILSRKDIYPAAKKLSWLIDRTASLIGTGGMDLKDSDDVSGSLIQKKTEFISSGDLSEELVTKIRIAEIYLSNKMNLKSNQKKSINNVMDYLDGLKTFISKMSSIKKLILEGKFDDAMEAIQPLGHDIISSCIKAKFEYDKDYNFLYVVSALQLYKVSFYKAYITLLQDDIFGAFNYLTESAYWALQSHQDKALLNTVYMKAILFFFNFDDIPDFYRKAIENFEYARFLSDALGDKILSLKCLLGKAISAFQVEEIDKAKEYISQVQKLAMKNPVDAVQVFTEMADYFLIFGKPEYAVFLYDEALEAACNTTELDHKMLGLLEKMKRSYIIAGVKQHEIVRAGIHLDTLLDDSFHIQGKDELAKYNDQFMKLAQFNSLLYEPFDIIYKTWTQYRDIDKSLKQDFEIIEIENMGEVKSRVIAYSSDLGLIAFNVPTKINLVGPAESYIARLSLSSEIKIRQVKGDLFEKKLIRALIYLKEPAHLEFEKQVPAFLKVMG